MTLRNPYNHFSNFILRTPLLNLEFYETLTAQETISTETFQKVIDDNSIREALFLASPTLFFEIKKWSEGELDAKKKKKLEHSLLKYLTRMSTRCTPFGLFAGCGLGSFSSETKLNVLDAEKHRRHTRLDMNYLVAFSQDLTKNKTIRDQLKYYPNSSIYPTGHQLRYIEYYYVESRRQHHIVEVDNSIYLQQILEAAKSGGKLKDFQNILEKEGIQSEEASDFVDELIDSQLLIGELEPSVSGPEFTDQILTILKKIKGTEKEIQFLKEINGQLSGFDNMIGNDPSVYLKLSEELKKQPTTFELKYLFQTDLELATIENILSEEVANQVKKGMTFLNRLTFEPQETNLSKFKDAFRERYEEREMPIAKALDVETGIGYLQEVGSGDVNPLVDDILLPGKEDSQGAMKVNWDKVQEILRNKLIASDRQGSQKIILKDKDFEAFTIGWDDLPDTMSTMIELINDNGKEKIKFSGTGGSSAANLLGRFCHGDSRLNEYTHKITETEAQINKEKILAEIVHLPEARVGNILMRPSFRDYEIPYLAKSSLDAANQIQLEDLMISVRNDRIFLRSKNLGKEIIPHLTNAHNFSNNALPIYQFLCDLQTQGIRSGLYFSFGMLANNRDFLPRVEYDNLILHYARWRIKKEEIANLLSKKDDLKSLKKEIVVFRNARNIPKHVLLTDGDNELLINLENLTSVQMLLEMVKNRLDFLLTEFLFSTDSFVQSGEEHKTNQIVISFFNEEKFEKQNNLQE